MTQACVNRNVLLWKTSRNASGTPDTTFANSRQIMKFFGEDIRSANVTCSIIAPSCLSTFS